MAKFSRFEEIQAWQKAYEVTLTVYKVTSDGCFAKGLYFEGSNSSSRSFDNGKYCRRSWAANQFGIRKLFELIAWLNRRSSIASLRRTRFELCLQTGF